MEQLAKQISNIKREIESRNDRLSLLLGQTDFAELEAAVNAIAGEVRSKAELEREIRTACDGREVGRYIAATEATVKIYEDDYGSVNSLKEKIADITEQLNRAEESVRAVQDIPEEYADITDPEGHLARLQKELDAKRALREDALTAKNRAEKALEDYEDSHPGDLAEDSERAERRFHEEEELLEHWLNIAEVFEEQKQQVQNNPMQDISDSFARYLSIISDDKISSEFPNLEKLDMSIYSDNHLLDYGKLSEGTKDTVSLAFRLAVLDHLFPDGGGVIVFDDPFTDMDADRLEQSCALILECAKRHQVIFLTCSEEYAKMLGVEEIRM